MQFLKTLLLAMSLQAIAFAAALPALTGRQTPPGSIQFALVAARTATPIHLQQLVARDQRIWIGGDTNTSCPASANCTAYGTQTAFIGGTAGNQIEIGMDVVVPDGQTLFAYADGSIQYTEAGDNCIPAMANSDIWNFEGPGHGKTFPSLSVADGRAFLACPATKMDKYYGPWQVFLGPLGVFLPSGITTDDCWAFATIASTVRIIPAYQYD